MGWRFRKRIKIAPGVNINLSKSGISTTIGKRGASVNFGKRGSFLNLGIPGTGLYSRTKFKETKTNPNYGYVGKSYKSSTYRHSTHSNRTRVDDMSFVEILLFLLSFLSCLVLPFYITMHRFRFENMNHKVIYVCIAIIAFYFIYQYCKFIKERKQKVINWFEPLFFPSLLWIVVCGGLSILNLIASIFFPSVFVSEGIYRRIMSLFIAIVLLIVSLLFAKGNNNSSLKIQDMA